jgi:hypothetical protein
MRDNNESIAHLPFVFMAKLHQFFQDLASFSQNSVNTNKVEINHQNFDVKQVATAVKLMTKFIKKMTEHIEDMSVPKEIPPFARTFFGKQDSRKITLAATTKQKMNVKQPSATTKGGKRKSDGTDPAPKRKKKETSNKSLAMGIFHAKKGTSVKLTKSHIV